MPNRSDKRVKDLEKKYSKDKVSNKKDTKEVIIPDEAKELNHKEIIFCEEYIKTRNATKSYQKVSPNCNNISASRLGSRWLNKVYIRKYIDERLKPIEEEEEKKAIADSNELLEFITSVIRGEVKDQLGFDTSVKDRLTATKMLAERYSLFTNPEKEKEENNNQSKVIIEVVDNSNLEKTLYDENNTTD